MLKLTMNSRKRTKRVRAIHSRKHRSVTSQNMVLDANPERHTKDAMGDNLRAMLRQEKTGKYNCVDYLSMTPWQQDVYQLSKKCPTETRKPFGNETRIDEYCREQIVEWSFRVVDYFRIDREVVAVSISFLDRFLATCRCDRTSFKLAATTTLQLAVKLLYPCKLADLGILSDLSRGEFDMKDIADMENHILRALSWHLHPPTAVAFASILLDYMFNEPLSMELTDADIDDLYDVSSFFGDLAVCDYFFVPLRASSIAIASILNALEGMFGPDNRLGRVVLKAARDLGLSVVQDLSAARNRLWELYERSEEFALNNNKVVSDGHQSSWQDGILVKKVSTTSSPVSVSSSTCTSGPQAELVSTRRSAKVIQNNTSW